MFQWVWKEKWIKEKETCPWIYCTIVSHDLSVLNMAIMKKGDNDLPGLTDTEKPRMRGPKRASKNRKLFNLRRMMFGSMLTPTVRTSLPKLGKLLARHQKSRGLWLPSLCKGREQVVDKKKRIAKAKEEAAEYQKLLASRLKEQCDRRSESLAKRRSKLSVASKPSVVA